MTTKLVDHSEEGENLVSLPVQPIVKRLHPDFNEQIAQEMEEAYQLDPDFVGTKYAAEGKLIKAFHLNKEINYLSGRIETSDRFT